MCACVRASERVCVRSCVMCVCVCACARVCMCMYVRVYACVCMYLSVCISVCVPSRPLDILLGTGKNSSSIALLKTTLPSHFITLLQGILPGSGYTRRRSCNTI